MGWASNHKEAFGTAFATGATVSGAAFVVSQTLFLPTNEFRDRLLWLLQSSGDPTLHVAIVGALMSLNTLSIVARGQRGAPAYAGAFAAAVAVDGMWTAGALSWLPEFHTLIGRLVVAALSVGGAVFLLVRKRNAEE